MMKDIICGVSVIILVLFIISVIVFICDWAVFGYHTPFKRTCYIEQKVILSSYTECTYSILTYLRITNKYGLNPMIEKSSYKFNVKKENICAAKERQYEKMYPQYLKVVAFLELGVNPCE